VVAAVLGMASSGPMARITMMLRTLENLGPKRPAKCSMVPPALAAAIMPIRGMPMPVIKKPRSATLHIEPDKNPIYGGKMRFPAPKNMAKRAIPTQIASLVFLFIRVLLQIQTLYIRRKKRCQICGKILLTIIAIKIILFLYNY
jgi:hypothetical protein